MAEHDEHSAADDALEEFGRREYFRVKCRVAIRTRELNADESDRLRLTIGERKPREEPKIDPFLRQWLERLESKLDAIHAHLDPEFERPLGSADLREIEISGNGLAWRDAPLYREGTWVRVDLELPGSNPVQILVLGRAVARHGNSKEGETQPIAFEVIYEGDRDAIVRHCLDIERRNIQRESGRPR